MINHFSNYQAIQVPVHCITEYLDQLMNHKNQIREAIEYYLMLLDTGKLYIYPKPYVEMFDDEFSYLENVIFAEDHDVINLVFNYGLTNCWVTALQITFPQLIRVPSE